MMFRVKTGFGTNDFLRIGKEDLEKAIRAQGSGKVFICNEGTVSGNHILSITPDWNHFLGLNTDARLEALDFKKIEDVRAQYSLAIQEEAIKVFGKYNAPDGYLGSGHA